MVQTLSQGADRLLPLVVSVLQDTLRPRGILARNDPRVRLLEGLEQKVEVLAGEVPETVPVTESGIRYDVDLRRGQKTGLFLDQREKPDGGGALRAWPAARLLHLHRRVCARARAPVPRGRGDRHLRGRDCAPEGQCCLQRHPTIEPAGNVFDELRGLDRLGERFDTIVLDPPAFAKNKAAVANARAGYKEINLRALKLPIPAARW